MNEICTLRKTYLKERAGKVKSLNGENINILNTKIYHLGNTNSALQRRSDDKQKGIR